MGQESDWEGKRERDVLPIWAELKWERHWGQPRTWVRNRKGEALADCLSSQSREWLGSPCCPVRDKCDIGTCLSHISRMIKT